MACSIQADRGGFEIDVAFDSPARIVGLQGVSGAGKTSLLHAMAGLVPVARSRLIVDGIALVNTDHGLSPHPHARRIGYVFQDTRLFPHLSVADNIAYGRRFAVGSADSADVIEVLGIGPLMSRWPRNLSGGEARRVAIARALAVNPRLLLLDEPFSGLDQARRDELIPYLQTLTRQVDVAIVVVSHDAADLTALGADPIHMTSGRISPVRQT